MDENVKCIDCGNVCLRNVATRELVEVESDIRQTGDIPPTTYINVLICFVRAFQLHDELQQEQGVFKNKFLNVINKNRKCPKFIAWQQGFTPKEHQEMIYTEEMRKQDAAERERVRAFQSEQTESTRKIARATWLGPVVGALISAIAAGLGGLAITWLNTQPSVGTNAAQHADSDIDSKQPLPSTQPDN